MILLEDILDIHEKSLRDYGGGSGVRDLGLLESAIARPFQTFGGEDLYPDAFTKAAALGESLIINHPFVDGNKRTGIAALITLLIEFNFIITSPEEDLYNLTIDISTGTIKFDEIVAWLKINTQPFLK
jgi:death on curing protein